ncbi:MAG: hypothetical protein MRY79_07980 [Alphaproteobacteria bacterium]|nr:hypothetical protein [Alphaproteobacteria bacterium]
MTKPTDDNDLLNAAAALDDAPSRHPATQPEDQPPMTDDVQENVETAEAPKTLEEQLREYDEEIVSLEKFLEELKSDDVGSHAVPRDQQANAIRRYLIRLGGRHPHLYTKEEAIEASEPGRNIMIASSIASLSLGAYFGVTQTLVNQLISGQPEFFAVAQSITVLGGLYGLISLIVDKGFYKQGREQFKNDTKHYFEQLREAKGDFNRQAEIRAKINSIKNNTQLMSYETARLAAAYVGAIKAVMGGLMLAYGSDMQDLHQDNYNNEQVPINDAVIAEKKAEFEALTQKRVEAEETVANITEKLGGGGAFLNVEQQTEINRIRAEEIAPLKEQLTVQEQKLDEVKVQITREEGGIGETGKAGRGPVYRSLISEREAIESRVDQIRSDIQSAEKSISEIQADARQSAKTALASQKDGLQAQLEAAQTRLKEAQDAENAARDYKAAAQADTRYKEFDPNMGVDDRYRTMFQAVLNSHPAAHVGTLLGGILLWNAETTFLKNIREDLSDFDFREIEYQEERIKRDALISDTALRIEQVKVEKQLILNEQQNVRAQKMKGSLAAEHASLVEQEKNDLLAEQRKIFEKRIALITDALDKIGKAVNAPSIQSLEPDKKKDFEAQMNAMRDEILKLRDNIEKPANQNEGPKAEDAPKKTMA